MDLQTVTEPFPVNRELSSLCRVVHGQFDGDLEHVQAEEGHPRSARTMVRQGDALKAVVRYQFAVSDGDNGLQLQPRYEQEIVPDGFGDRYQAVYAGIDYLIFGGDRFKLMTDAEYSVMDDSANDGGQFEGWTYLAGVRLFF